MNDPGEKLAGWMIEDHLAFDIGFALPRASVQGLRRALTEDERRGALPRRSWITFGYADGSSDCRGPPSGTEAGRGGQPA